MDSSNSGSFQSSSGAAGTAPGGDNEEYDSTTHSISSFFNPPSHFNPNLNHLLHPPPPPPPPLPSSSHHHHRPPPTDTTFFNPSSLLNSFQDPSTPWTAPTPPLQPNHHHHHNNNNTGVTIKNPKKRTRASRRAPTTVLTTDTTNFRQMVQEFTGIPTSPFSTTAPFSRRLDLFRPTAQQPPATFLNPTANIVDSGTCNNITTATSSSGFKLHPSSVLELQKQPSTLMDLQNRMLSFQSVLQTSVPQETNDLNGLQSASKRWREGNEKLGSFEDDNIGRSKLDSGLDNVVVSSRSVGGDQVQGNQGSWICPSN